jgi:hypothetical protein
MTIAKKTMEFRLKFCTGISHKYVSRLYINHGRTRVCVCVCVCVRARTF